MEFSCPAIPLSSVACARPRWSGAATKAGSSLSRSAASAPSRRCVRPDWPWRASGRTCWSAGHRCPTLRATTSSASSSSATGARACAIAWTPMTGRDAPLSARRSRRPSSWTTPTITVSIPSACSSHADDQRAVTALPGIRLSGMRSPRGRGQQLNLLRRDQRTEFRGETLDEVLVGEDRRPVRATIGVVVELPEVDELIDHARVGLDVADQLLGLAALLERRVAELGVELDGFAHLADVERVWRPSSDRGERVG